MKDIPGARWRLELGPPSDRCLTASHDLVSVMALPAMWSVAEPAQIVRTLLDVLPAMLDLEVLCIRLREPIGDALVEVVRGDQLRAFGERLECSFGDDPTKWPVPGRHHDISLAALALHGEFDLMLRRTLPVQMARGIRLGLFTGDRSANPAAPTSSTRFVEIDIDRAGSAAHPLAGAARARGAAETHPPGWHAS